MIVKIDLGENLEENPNVIYKIPSIIDPEGDIPTFTVSKLEQIPCKCVIFYDNEEGYFIEVDKTKVTILDNGSHTIEFLLKDDENDQEIYQTMVIVIQVE